MGGPLEVELLEGGLLEDGPPEDGPPEGGPLEDGPPEGGPPEDGPLEVGLLRESTETCFLTTGTGLAGSYRHSSMQKAAELQYRQQRTQLQYVRTYVRTYIPHTYACIHTCSIIFSIRSYTCTCHTYSRYTLYILTFEGTGSTPVLSPADFGGTFVLG